MLIAPRQKDAATKEDGIDNASKKMWTEALGMGYLGIFFGVAIAIGYFGGAWADGRLGTEPWLSLAGVLLGVATGCKELYRLVVQHRRRLSRKEDP